MQNSENSKPLLLRDLVNLKRRQLVQISKQLAEREVKLDATGFEGSFPEKKLKLLFSQIPKEHLHHNVGFYIDLHTIDSHQLSNQISNLKNLYTEKKIPKIVTLSIIGLPIILFALFALKGLEFFIRPKVSATSLKIGTLWKPESTTELRKFLEKEIIPNDFGKFIKGEKIDIILEGDKTLTYSEARNRILNQDWDIAFTLSPMLSITARESGYTFAARMFPGQPAYYRSAIYVRSDSRIKSLADLNSSITIAMGEVNSASSFYMPAYDLFGKTLTVNLGNRGQKIRELVKLGKVDLGASAWGDTVKNDDPSIRVIHLSRKIPGSGVYLSPHLSPSDQEVIKETLLKAPEKVREKANFGAGDEPDYRPFLGIVRQTEELLLCADFKKNPVSFFCSPEKFLPKTQSVPEVNGVVNGFSQINNNQAKIIIEGNKNGIYEVIFPSNWLSKSLKISASNLQDKKVKLKNIKFNRIDGNIYSSILEKSDQLNLLN